METVVIFGGAGFVGSHIIRRIAKKGYKVIVPYQSQANEPKIRLLGSFGQITPFKYNNLDDESVIDSIKRADLIFNLKTLWKNKPISYEEGILNFNIRIIDISADFRITNVEVWEKWYGQKHLSPTLLSESIYGLPEIPGQRQKIREALIVANPGCYPTSALLALLPIHSNLDKQQIIVNSTSGISGAGRNLDSRKLFAEGHDNFQAYAVGAHRHYPEMLQTLNKANPNLDILFVPHLSSIARGIYSTIYLRYEFEEIDEVVEAYKAFYDDSPFVQIITEQTFPKISESTGTNMCNISIHKAQAGDEGANLVILSALDNLIKGASGQAVQNMNIMFNLDEKLSLV